MEERRLGERVAVLEGRMDRAETDILSLRTSRHNHSERLQALVDAPADIRELQEFPPRVERLEEEVEEMTKTLLPEQNRTITELAQQMRDVRDKVMTRSTDVGWLMRIASFVMQGVITPIALLWLGWVLSHR